MAARGGREGSPLLGGWMSAVAAFSRSPPRTMEACRLAVVGLLSVDFLLCVC